MIRRKYSLIKEPLLSEFVPINVILGGKVGKFKEPFGGFESHFQDDHLELFLNFAEYILNDESSIRRGLEITRTDVDISKLDIRKSILEIENSDGIQNVIYEYWREQALKYDAMRNQLVAGLRKCARSPRVPPRIQEWNNTMIEYLGNESLLIRKTPNRQIGDSITITFSNAITNPDFMIDSLPALARQLLPHVPDKYVHYSHKRQINNQAELFPNVIQLHMLNYLYQVIMLYRRKVRIRNNGWLHKDKDISR